MNLAILETGTPPPQLIAEHGRYPAMFERLLGLEAASYDVAAGELPAERPAHDAYLVTGAAAGVYDELPWIAELIGFLRAARGKAKLVGICFGHQVMAEAFGGKVELSAKGWGAGLMRYQVATREPWMDEAESVALPASHQDQVVIQPPQTELVLASAFTPFAGLAWRDQSAVSIQPHPEFS